MPDFSDFMQEAVPEFGKLLERAYQAGFEAGRHAGAKEVRDNVSRAIGIDLAVVTAASQLESKDDAQPDADGEIEEEAEGRLPPGSVKPAILKLIQDHPGLKRNDIVHVTRFKPNSVRGTLWSLQAQDKAIFLEGGRWYPVTQQKSLLDDQGHNADLNLQSLTSDGEAKNNPASEQSVEDPLARFFGQPEAQGREAGPGGGT